VQLVSVRRGPRWTLWTPSDEQGRSELFDFFDSLDETLVASREKLLALLDHVGRQGPQGLPVEISHEVAPYIWQFRKGRLRLLWFYDDGRVVICAHAFIKKTPKTPKDASNRAVALRKAYLEAKKRGKLRWLEEGEE
jgi:phage-related protein